MNDPQIWTLIAVFAGFQVVLLRQVHTLDQKHDARFDALDRRFDEVDRRFDEVDRRFGEERDLVNARFDHQMVVMNERFDHQNALMDVRFGALEHRVAALEDDMKLVKAHLIPPAA